jgi:PAS domain S-box-containing protein
MRLYEQAIRSARDNGFVHHEALANEIAARFYAARGLETSTRAYLKEARYGYLRWGADAKVRQLDELYPHLKTEPVVPGPTATIGTPVEQLDLAMILRVSQAVSGEIVLEKLIDTLMRTAIEHAGAERGLLILPRGAELRIQAEATTAGSPVMIALRDAPISSAELPEPVVQYAARTQESVILDDALARGSFSHDEYIRRKHARSILCLPLVKQGRLIAVLYLENNLAANVFTPARIAVLNVLTSAAAISLENSRLYREIQEREAKIRRLVDANIVGVLVSDLEGRVIEANDAFLQMVRYTRDDLTSGRLRWTELTPREWQAVSERAVAQLRANGTCELFEKEYFRSDGTRVPVLGAAAATEGTRTENVAFVLDLTERKRAEEALHNAQAELTHVTRLLTLGELTASIAHEVNQPLAGVTTNGNAGLRWLARDPPDLAEARECLQRIIRDGHRASEVIARMHAFARKAAPQTARLAINDVIAEVLALADGELRRHGVALHTDLTADLPLVRADPRPAAAGAPESAAERHGIHAHGDGPAAGVGRSLAEKRIRWRPGCRPRRRHGHRPAGSGADLHPILYDQARRHGHGAGDQPLDRRGARRPIVGHSERRSRRDLSVHPARR